MKLKPIARTLAARLALNLAINGKLPTKDGAVSAAVEEVIRQYYAEKGIDITTTPASVEN